MSIARIPGSSLHRVAGILDGLSDGCVVVHDQTLGRRGVRVDHIVVGPFGVLCLTARHQRGRVTVNDQDCVAEGERLDLVTEARATAELVGVHLKGATGLDCSPLPVVVLIGAHLTIQKRPAGVTVLTDEALGLWLRSLPRAFDEVEEQTLARAAGAEATWAWRPARRRRRLRKRPLPIPPVDETVTRASLRDWALFETWVRSGEHRFYVHDPDGRRLACYDVEANELVLIDETVRGFAEAMLGPHMEAEYQVRTDPTISSRVRDH
jgi:Nuclease-related domain